MAYSLPALEGSDEDYSRSVLGGSEEYFSRKFPEDYNEVNEIYCEPCTKEGNTVDAVKRCVDCAEDLCEECFKSHAKFKLFQNHVTNDVNTVNPVTKKSGKISTSTVRDRPSAIEIDSKTDRQISRRAKVKKSSMESNKKLSAKSALSIDVRSSSDKETPYIRDLTIVRSHYCVVADNKNKSVKVVDTRKRCVVSEKLISDADGLYAITPVNDDQVAVSVTIKGGDKLVFFSVSTSGIVSLTDRSLEMKTFYLGIIHNKDRLYANDTNKIEIISGNGQMIKTINNDAFGQLYGIALSNDQNKIYACGHSKDTVFSVDLEGNIKTTYKDQDLKKPMGVTMDSKGYVYVCGIDTHCVHQLTADLTKVQVIISPIDAGRCTFNRAENRLYVSCYDRINMYDMNYE